MLTKAYSTVFFCLKTLAVAISRDVFNNILGFAMQDVTDGVMACDVFDLASAELVSRRIVMFVSSLLSMNKAIMTACSLDSSIFSATYFIYLAALR